MGHGGGRQKKGTKAKITQAEAARQALHAPTAASGEAPDKVTRADFDLAPVPSPGIAVCEGGILLLWLGG